MATAKTGEFTVILKGYAKNSSDKFPITFKFSESNNPVGCFYGCKMEIPRTGKGDKIFKTFMPIVAFGDMAEVLQGVEDGDWIEVAGEFQYRKGNDDKFYPQVVVNDVLKL